VSAALAGEGQGKHWFGFFACGVIYTNIPHLVKHSPYPPSRYFLCLAFGVVAEKLREESKRGPRMPPFKRRSAPPPAAKGRSVLRTMELAVGNPTSGLTMPCLPYLAKPCPAQPYPAKRISIQRGRGNQPNTESCAGQMPTGAITESVLVASAGIPGLTVACVP
jgi:hypothetical protein